MATLIFFTCDGKLHTVNKWDLLIAHPPCTYLSVAGNRSYSLRLNSPQKVAERIKQRDKAVEFFLRFINADCDKICVENPVGYMNTHFRKADQIIHPYFFLLKALTMWKTINKKGLVYGLKICQH